MYAASALKQYQSVNTQARVVDASPHRLIQMLMEGGLTRIAQARGAMERGQTALKGELIGKSIAIIAGLRDSLDHQQGGELAGNLDSLYGYMMARLTEANISNEPAVLEEVAGLLRDIKTGWDGIAD
ncbi:flagellar export chaperone FliS [Pseudomonas sp. NCCP-436]|uniref:flagellar export chaperone FliS n=1 Tax=Pseudomonas sp. NCCP-436 TaxID=2842481 RepID=UPI001C827870|nr:flagellar export chaperone FliS [Pseudomonas sp. NCCP-436]GIZ12186.1 B-type flagellar protein FliS [Pseudomonas sp. NCCP-436]